MIKINTKHFGELEINDESIIFFPAGIIAFAAQKRFVLIENQDQDLPFHWLQSVDDSNLCFVITNPFLFKKDYEFDLNQETLKQLELERKEDVQVFAIVVVPEDISKMTFNLLAPIIINTENKRGKQVILNDKRYRTRHLILEELNCSRGGK